MIIDAHIHTYPSADIGRRTLGSFGYGYNGSVAEINEVMEHAGISHAVMANFLPVREMAAARIANLEKTLSETEKEKAISNIHKKMAERVERNNRWTCEVSRENPSLVPLIGVDPFQAQGEMVREVGEKVLDMGAKGVKLHPIVNAQDPGDKKMWPLYEKCQELEIPILFHSGKSDLPNYDNQYGNPELFREAATAFPDLTIVLAHLGKGYSEGAVELAKKCPNVFFDASACFYHKGFISREKTVWTLNLIRRIGTHRVMFGTDWPWCGDPLNDIQVIKNSDLKDHDKERILGLNARRIYKISF